MSADRAATQQGRLRPFSCTSCETALASREIRRFYDGDPLCGACTLLVEGEV